MPSRLCLNELSFNAGGGGDATGADGATRRCDGVDCDDVDCDGKGSGEDAAMDGGGSDGASVVHCDGVEGETERDSHVSTTDGFPT